VSKAVTVKKKIVSGIMRNADNSNNMQIQKQMSDLVVYARPTYTCTS